MTPRSLSAEVVIVGGGPAGAATAIALRRRGVDVLVLDRAKFPRDKVCGDVLLPEARSNLRALGLDLRKLDARAYRCTGARYVAMNGSEIAGPFRNEHGAVEPWWMVPRRDLDEWLLAEACRAGASVVEGIAVDGVLRDGDDVCGVTTRGRLGVRQHIRARVVVGADGASSVIAREVGAFARRAEHTCLAARAYVESVSLPEPNLEVFTSTRTLPGCAWIVPVGPDEVNVGIGVVQSTAQRLGVTPQALFDEIRFESPLLNARLQNAGPIRLQGWTLPSATERRRIAGNGWLLVGDAAAMVDPFTGHGIHTAIAAGRIAGDTIADALAVPQPACLEAYERRCRDTFDMEVTDGMLLQQLHARPGVTRAIVAACAMHPGLRQTFLSLVGHSAPRRALLTPVTLIRSLVSPLYPAASHREGATA